MRNFRVVGEQDLEALAAMRWDFKTEGTPDASTDCDRWDFIEACTLFLQRGLRRETWVYWVAEEAEEIVSHLFIQMIEKVPAPGDLHPKWGYVTNVYTRPDFRDRGVGSELMEHVVRWAGEIGLELLIVWPSRESATFYRRAGFENSGEIMELNFENEGAS
ncbi:MAG: GNAT family N-acetyltransferase [Armatimonadetes bacterium]|nr:GNAT family N-acetyltransferase [Armatimonadota bacterium]